jgi:hypothetical protein
MMELEVWLKEEKILINLVLRWEPTLMMIQQI